jgi:hypothetical protein
LHKKPATAISPRLNHRISGSATGGAVGVGARARLKGGRLARMFFSKQDLLNLEDSMLREKIKRLIDAASNSDDASMLICQFLEDELELSGNGWFDDDPVLEPLFCESEDEDTESASEELFNRVEAILTPQEV